MYNQITKNDDEAISAKPQKNQKAIKKVLYKIFVYNIGYKVLAFAIGAAVWVLSVGLG